ncbi:hypothetical protein [Pseudoalteromonas tunicata]|uniref:hypothetical protein n=1 Tax=Pseudoalteromonas tunicata TaxID=314281 RepID=UPI00273E377E|nr:hypothetical protein [Pseudoalteromonas tunicata]MDP4982524.1 hypothetical protein [Pseudoalteromonas tunicata]
MSSIIIQLLGELQQTQLDIQSAIKNSEHELIKQLDKQRLMQLQVLFSQPTDELVGFLPQLKKLENTALGINKNAQLALDELKQAVVKHKNSLKGVKKYQLNR